jgi:hypothetical protein
MSNKCFRPLNLPVTFKAQDPNFGTSQHVTYDLAHANELVDWLKTLGLKPGFAEVFKKPPGYEFPNALHIDGEELDDHVKINFVYGIGSSKMRWWEIKEGCSYKKETTVVGTKYFYANRDDCNMVAESSIEKPTLVNAGMLHNVELVDQERWCYSFMLVHETGGRLYWNEAMEIFKDFIDHE